MANKVVNPLHNNQYISYFTRIPQTGNDGINFENSANTGITAQSPFPGDPSPGSAYWGYLYIGFSYYYLDIIEKYYICIGPDHQNCYYNIENIASWRSTDLYNWTFSAWHGGLPECSYQLTWYGYPFAPGVFVSLLSSDIFKMPGGFAYGTGIWQGDTKMAVLDQYLEINSFIMPSYIFSYKGNHYLFLSHRAHPYLIGNNYGTFRKKIYSQSYVFNDPSDEDCSIEMPPEEILLPENIQYFGVNKIVSHKFSSVL